MAEHRGGCHCGNLRVTLRLTQEPAEMQLRARAHNTRTASDPHGLVGIRAGDWAQVQFYRFGTSTADFVICRNCGVYIGAIGETPSGTRAVINTTCLDDRALFTTDPAPTDHDGETTESRLARRAANWTPAAIHR